MRPNQRPSGTKRSIQIGSLLELPRRGRAAELEGTAATREPDRRAMAVRRRHAFQATLARCHRPPRGRHTGDFAGLPVGTTRQRAPNAACGLDNPQKEPSVAATAAVRTAPGAFYGIPPLASEPLPFNDLGANCGYRRGKIPVTNVTIDRCRRSWHPLAMAKPEHRHHPKCEVCGKRFAAKRSDARICSNRCRQQAHRDQLGGKRRQRRTQPPMTEIADQQVVEELTRVTREQRERIEELTHQLDQARGALRGVYPTSPRRGDHDDIRSAYFQSLLDLPMHERIKDMQLLSEWLAADEAGTARRHGRAVAALDAVDADLNAALDADFDADLDLDEDSIDD
jgi:predicted nucleic acid-binding Zn ribbon protein